MRFYCHGIHNALSQIYLALMNPSYTVASASFEAGTLYSCRYTSRFNMLSVLMAFIALGGRTGHEVLPFGRIR